MHKKCLWYIRERTKCFFLHDLELVENVGFEALVRGEARAGQILLHCGVVLCRLAVLVSAEGVASQVAEAGVEACFYFLAALGIGLFC